MSRGVVVELPDITEEEAQRLAKLVKELAENADALESLVRLARKLKESGLLAIVEAVAETGAEGFVAATRLELMSMVANMMMVAYMIGQLNHELMMEATESVPRCLDEAYREFSKDHRKMGLFELLSIVRSPEFTAALKAMQQMLRCFRQKQQ